MIRRATEKDLPQLIELATRLRDESPVFRDISIDTEKLTALYKRGFDTKANGVCIFVYERTGRIQGAMLGVQAEYFFSRERYAADLFLFVDQELRRGLMSGVIAKRLWEQFRDWAAAQGLREVRNGVTTGIAIEGAHRFFTKLGMQHIGGMYALPLQKAKA